VLLILTSVLAAILVLGGAGAFWLRARRMARRPSAPAPQALAPAPMTPPVLAPIPPPVGPPVPAPVQPPPPEPVPAAPAGKTACTTLDQAADALADNPGGALAFLEPTVAAEPGNDRAFALRIVALYNLGRYGASGKAIREAREAGHALWPMALKYPVLRAMLEKDAKEPRLPKRKAPAAPPPEPEPTATL
jgi:hypothetical protein